MSNELKITKERVLSAAEKDSTVREALKELFPDAFEGDVFDFGYFHELNLTSDGPLVIGNGLAPKGLQHKCLVVNRRYDMEVIEWDGRKCLIFREKL